MTGVEVRVRFVWSGSCPVTLDGRDHLAAGDVPDVPGVYRWTLTDAPGQDRPAVYIGEGTSLRTRIGNYRRPSRMRTAGELHRMFVGHLRAGGLLTLDVATSAHVDPAHGGDPLTRRSLRRLVEGAAIAAEYAADTVDVLNHDSGQGARRMVRVGQDAVRAAVEATR